MPARPVHTTIAMQVWADVDIGIAETVRRLNAIPGVRTHASCQGSVGEGGAKPYRPYVMVSWRDGLALDRLRRDFDIDVQGESHGLAHPRAAPTASPGTDAGTSGTTPMTDEHK